MSEIVFSGVHKRYAGASTDTIRAVDLKIDHGEFVVFVGPSGCGKSTLLRMVAGLEDISSGSLHIKGQKVNDVPPSRRGVAMVFQSYALYPHMTVYDNMAFGLKQAKTNAGTIDQRVRKASAILQLDPLLDRLPKQLSGGQRQRVAIGRAIVREPDVFLFDEPLSNLDAGLRVQTRLELAKLHQDIGSASMIYVTHDQVEAMTLASKIVLLNSGPAVQSDGSVAQYGAPLALYHHPVNKFVAGFIGSPKMNFIAARLGQADAGSATLQVGPAAALDAAGGSRGFNALVDARHLAAGAVCTLGVRPEHVRLAAPGEPNSLVGQVAFVERLGEASYLYVRLTGAELVTVRESGTSACTVGQALHLFLPPHALHLFGPDDKACRRTTDAALLGQAHGVGGHALAA